MTLLVDAGPHGIRWARLEGSVPGPMVTASHRSYGREDWERLLAALRPSPARILVASVAGAGFVARFGAWTQRQWGVAPECVLPVATAHGLTNACADPMQLGADRWLAMIAARHAVSGPLVVVTAGAAVTVDLVDESGVHRGGSVLPGERLMREALYTQTSGVAAAALLDPAAVDGVFGINTAGAVQQGARLALGAVIDRLAGLLEGEVAASPTVFVTGAASDEVSVLVTRPHRRVPELVLQGLAIIAIEGVSS